MGLILNSSIQPMRNKKLFFKKRTPKVHFYSAIVHMCSLMLALTNLKLGHIFEDKGDATVQPGWGIVAKQSGHFLQCAVVTGQGPFHSLF